MTLPTSTTSTGRGPGVLERCCKHLGEVDRRRGLSAAQLQREYLSPRKPVVLQGEMDSWDALNRWSFDFFRKEHGSIEVPVGRLFERQGTMPLGDYVDYVRQWRVEHDEADPIDLPLYADGCFIDKGSSLANDFSIPRCLSEIDWFEKYMHSPMGLGYLLIGPKGSMTKLHIDGQYSHAWVAQVVGRKKWLIVPFDQLKGAFKNGYADYIGGYEGMEPPDIESWPDLANVGYYTAELAPGDLIVAPSAQFHEVVNLEDSIALTNNFVDRSNAVQVGWSFLMTKLGLRKDRRAERAAL